jgi:catechol 2,3-dioxygenase-like lactoylglutathione lyase family enzyme
MIDHIDHVVLTTRDLQGCIRFYVEVLGMKLEKFGERLALRFGTQKLNLHEWGREFTPRAHVAAPSSTARWRRPAPRGRSARYTCATRT